MLRACRACLRSVAATFLTLSVFAACSDPDLRISSNTPSSESPNEPSEEEPPAAADGGLDAKPKPPKPPKDGGVVSDPDSSIPLPLDGDGCLILTPFSFEVSGNWETSLLLKANLDTPGGSLEVTVKGADLAAQAYTLGVAPEDPFASPSHARVIAYPSGTFGGNTYVATSGTLTLTSVTNPLTVEVAGQLTTLKLIETITVDGGWAPKPQGRCLSLAAASFDTRVAVGDPCTSAKTCGTKMCDPLTLTCKPPSCTTEGATAGGFYCKEQRSSWSDAKALYRACTVGATITGCSAGEECLGTSGGFTPGTSGYCVLRGTHGLDDACTDESGDVSTGCSAGLLCRKFVGLSYVCGTRCDFFGANGQCPASERCQSYYSNAVCSPKPAITDTAKLDAQCTQPIAFCGDDGFALRGTCTPESSFGPPTCRKICRTNADCPAGKTCTAVLGANVCK